MEALKLVITGPSGAGKTSVIQAVSAVPVVSTEASAFRETSHHLDKLTTTIALDYGELTLQDGRVLMIIGTPGQSRYDFMCSILARGAMGLIILIDHTSVDPVADLRYFTSLYRELLETTPFMVGVTHTDQTLNESLDMYLEALALDGWDAEVPVVRLDARSPKEIIEVFHCLLAILEPTP